MFVRPVDSFAAGPDAGCSTRCSRCWRWPSIGGGYETVREAADATAYPMPGQLIDVGGHRLHLNCTGSGSPTVVLQPGGGDMSSTSAWIAPAVAARHPGLRLRPRGSRLERARRQPPGRRPDRHRPAHPAAPRDTCPDPTCWPVTPSAASTSSPSPPATPTRSPGMVLVDSTAPAPPPDPANATRYDAAPTTCIGRVSALASITARLGLARLVGHLGYDGLPPQARDEVRAKHRHRRQPSQHDRRVRPGQRLGAASRSAPGLRRQTAGRPHRRQPEATPPGPTAQNDLATLSTNSAHRVVDGATHEALVARPGERRDHHPGHPATSSPRSEVEGR